jgi:hypothetical protein
MDSRALILIAASTLFLTPAMAELQLTPRITEYELDGVKSKQLAFSNPGGKEITYAPPAGWSYSGSATKLTLHPGKPQAEATISKIPVPQEAVLDEPEMKKLVEEIVLSVPQGSTNVALLSQEKNPLLINRRETFLVTISYSFFGANYKRAVLFLNREKEQLRFDIVSLDKDFAELQRSFLGSQYTWQNL